MRKRTVRERGKKGSHREIERVWKSLTGQQLYFQYFVQQEIPHVEKVADDTDWSDLADLIWEERVHLANETANLVKH